MEALIITLSPTFKSAAFAGLSFFVNLVLFSSMTVSDLPSCILMVTVSGLTAVTVPIKWPCGFSHHGLLSETAGGAVVLYLGCKS